MARKDTRKTFKICLVCGEQFKGIASKMTCSNACRTAMSRIYAEGKNPPYYLIAKMNGQKVPEKRKSPESVSEVLTEKTSMGVKKSEEKEELSSFQIYQRKKLGLI